MAQSASAPAHSLADQTDLTLYRSSLLLGLHSHPVGFEGRKLDAAERNLKHRRTVIRDWLVAREGETILDKLDEEAADEAHGVFWVASRSVEDEWNSIRFANRTLKMLEKRKKLADRIGIHQSERNE
jgi:hypothetical protein